jgi:outer membrane usher protein FimD/PapC
MSKAKINIITEDTEVKFKEYEDLSFLDYGGDNVELYVNGEFLGEIEVFTDYENENREYICINHEVVYLDSIEEV